MEDIVIVGMGKYGMRLAESIRQGGKYNIIGYTDLQENPESDYLYLGTDEQLLRVFQIGIRNAAVGVGHKGKGEIREWLVGGLKKIGYKLPVIIDPSAMVAPNVEIGEGTYIGYRSRISQKAVIGTMCVIREDVVIDPEGWVGDYSLISTGTKIFNQAKIADHCLVGPDSKIMTKTSVGIGALIGPGATVIKDVPDGASYYGIA